MWCVIFKGMLRQEIVYCDDVDFSTHPLVILKGFKRYSSFPQPQLKEMEVRSYEQYKNVKSTTLSIWNLVEVRELSPRLTSEKTLVSINNSGEEKKDETF